MYPWTSIDHSLYMCTHTARTTLSYGWVVREYNVSMDIHRSFIVCVYTHNKDHVVPWLGSSRIQCIHGHPRITHCTYVCTHSTRTMLSHDWVVREYNVSMDIHGSFIVCVYTHNKDHVVPWLGSSRIQCIHGHPRITHCTYVCTHSTRTTLSHGWVVREYNVSMDIHVSHIVRMCVHTQQGPCCPMIG